jgi:N-methylhydantoinase B
VRTDRHYLAPAGVNGGRAARPADFVVNPDGPDRRELPGKLDGTPVRAGDVLLITSPGGGGWGNPLERDPALVELDLRRGLVSEAAVRDDYGVVPGDPEATVQRRAALRAAQGPLPMFDRGREFAAYAATGRLSLSVPDALPVASGH